MLSFRIYSKLVYPIHIYIIEIQNIWNSSVNNRSTISHDGVVINENTPDLYDQDRNL